MKTYSTRAIANRLDAMVTAGKATNGTLTVTMKADGEKLNLTLYSEMGIVPERFTDADFVLVSGPGVTNLMGGAPDRVCQQLAEYDRLKVEYRNQVDSLRRLCATHKDTGMKPSEDPAYQMFSDWHKDLFGYRPRGWRMPSAS